MKRKFRSMYHHNIRGYSFLIKRIRTPYRGNLVFSGLLTVFFKIPPELSPSTDHKMFFFYLLYYTTLGMDVLITSVCVILCRADHPSKEFYRLTVRFTLSELIFNGNSSDSLIRQGRRRRRRLIIIFRPCLFI
jgi:hypothetical protein